MHPREQLLRDPDRPAIIMAGSGAAITYRELDARANRAAHLLRNLGLQRGERVAIWMDNNPRYFDVCWAAHNLGLLFVPISARLTAPEAAYIVQDSDAKLVVASATLNVAGLRDELKDGPQVLVIGGEGSFDKALEGLPDTPPQGETRGAAMVYSSGTTGRPKGILPELPEAGIGEPVPLTAMLVKLYGFTPDSVYLSTAPLYHTAPLKFSMVVNSMGGTVVILEKFDPEKALAAIEKYGVTHSQWVPTMFVRALQLPDEVRARYDLSTHKFAIHAAAPCPVPIKERMIEWWGPIVYEYYGGSESVGQCAITPQEWLLKKGSVGRASRGVVHVMTEDGQELGVGETGLITFEGGSKFVYHKDPEKTARSFTRQGYGTFGDIGHIDADGYVFLTDRRDYVINSGGVNIYPQEAENLLASHPKVADVAVFGVPHPEYGEEVKAVVQARDPAEAGPALEAELIAHCRANMATNKCPRSIDFDPEMPREPTGKLLKRLIKARYWPAEQKPPETKKAG